MVTTYAATILYRRQAPSLRVGVVPPLSAATASGHRRPPHCGRYCLCPQSLPMCVIATAIAGDRASPLRVATVAFTCKWPPPMRGHCRLATTYCSRIIAMRSYCLHAVVAHVQPSLYSGVVVADLLFARNHCARLLSLCISVAAAAIVPNDVL
ncbi:hypothetical protein BHE74_00008810 [Ensete ventricosum]|nr:hypothetical protein BHE74_00008810 [Ensete ventricosum]